MKNLSKMKNTNPSSFPPIIFLSKIPQDLSRLALFDYFKANIGGIVYLKVRSKSRNTPKIGLIQVSTNRDFRAIINSSPIVLPCGAEILAERQLTGGELSKKEDNLKERRVSVLGIYGNVTDDMLKGVFEQFGKIDVAYSRRYKDNPHKAYGFVTFLDADSACRAIAAGRVRLNGKNARIQRFVKKNKDKCSLDSAGGMRKENIRSYEMVDPEGSDEVLLEEKITPNFQRKDPSFLHFDDKTVLFGGKF